MNKNNDLPSTMDRSLAVETIRCIQFLLERIWFYSKRMSQGSTPEGLDEDIEHLLGYTHEIHWKLADLSYLLPSIEKYSPKHPDLTTTTLADAVDEMLVGYRNEDLGIQLLRDCSELISLTLCYRELWDVFYIIRRLLYLLKVLQDQGSIITFQSSSESHNETQYIRLHIDCRNENVLHLKEDLTFGIPLPYQVLGSWHGRYISGLEFAVAKRCLVGIGGDFTSEKVGDHLQLDLVIPTLMI